MGHDIEVAKELGMDGIVLGILNERSEVDREGTQMLVKLAHPLPVTFHRAFDLCRDLGASLDAVIATGATRLLTADGNNGVSNGLPHLARLIANAADRIVIMPGGGTRASNIQRILSHTGAREIHSSLSRPRQSTNESHESAKRALKDRDRDTEKFEMRVRNFRRLVDTFSAQN
jgi:copper homeostasis protein